LITAVLWLVAPPLLDFRSSSSGLCAQQGTPAVTADTCSVDADGTAHVTRVIPVPRTISPEAQKFISRPGPSGPEPTLEQRRAFTDAFRKGRSEEARKL